MITEQALQEAIAECQGQRNPNRETCIMLAAFYTIQEHLFPKSEPAYSFAPAPESTDKVTYSSGSEFSQALQGRDINEVMPILEEMMDAVKTLLPRLYHGIMDKLS